jgi:transglutaminase-like putative cysteine protease
MEKDISEYLKKTRNCEVGDPYIKNKAESIIQGVSSTRDKAEKLFLFVRKNIKYNRYSNTKQGALKTLKKGTGNCCDQAHALVALLRSVGIPARYQRGICQGATSGHIWAQTYVNGKWATIDPTNKINDFDNVRRLFFPYFNDILVIDKFELGKRIMKRYENFIKTSPHFLKLFRK